MIYIGLVDDHEVTRRGIKTIIETQTDIKVVIEASNGIDLFNSLPTLTRLPDILILDVSMPGMNGYDTIIQLVAKFSTIKILVFSLISELDAIMNMINNGASGYIHKSADPFTLIDAIQTIQQQDYYINDLVKREYFASDDNDVVKMGQLGRINMTTRELEFIKLTGTNMTYKQMATYMRISPKTLENYRENLFKKLSVKNRAGLVAYGYRNGILNLSPGE